MEYRRLGRCGMKVSAIGLGTWLTFTGDPERAGRLVNAALDAGINFFDTANTDGQGAGEEALGRALAGHDRDDLVIATKVWGPMGRGANQRGLSRKHIMSQCEASLRRLGVERIDLYQAHRYDPETMLDETLRAMDDLVHQGKILYWGIAGWDESQVRNVATLAEQQQLYAPVSHQVRYNLLDRGAESLLSVGLQTGIAGLAYSPLAQGVLTGKYVDGTVPGSSRLADERTGENLRRRYGGQLDDGVVRRVRSVAQELGVAPAEVALAHVVAQPGVAAAIMGASRPEQVYQNARAVGLELPGDAFSDL